MQGMFAFGLWDHEKINLLWLRIDLDKNHFIMDFLKMKLDLLFPQIERYRISFREKTGIV